MKLSNKRRSTFQPLTASAKLTDRGQFNTDYDPKQFIKDVQDILTEMFGSAELLNQQFVDNIEYRDKYNMDIQGSQRVEFRIDPTMYEQYGIKMNKGSLPASATSKSVRPIFNDFFTRFLSRGYNISKDSFSFQVGGLLDKSLNHDPGVLYISAELTKADKPVVHRPRAQKSNPESAGTNSHGVDSGLLQWLADEIKQTLTDSFLVGRTKEKLQNLKVSVKPKVKASKITWVISVQGTTYRISPGSGFKIYNRNGFRDPTRTSDLSGAEGSFDEKMAYICLEIPTVCSILTSGGLSIESVSDLSYKEQSASGEHARVYLRGMVTTSHPQTLQVL